MQRWTSMAAAGLVSLALAGCGGGVETEAQSAPAAESTAEVVPAQRVEAAVRALTDRCLDADVDADGQTPAATEEAVDELMDAFELVDDRAAVRDEMRDALALVESGCASEATAERLAAAVGGDADVLDALGGEDCDAKGINAEEGEEGTCLVEGGPRVTVVDMGHTATTPEMAVTLLDVSTPGLPAPRSRPRRPSASALVLVTLRVGNRTNAVARFEPRAQVQLVLDERTYSPNEAETQEIEPGEERNVVVGFDVRRDAVDALETSGNVYVLGFSDAGTRFGEAAGTVAVLRTYK